MDSFQLNIGVTTSQGRLIRGFWLCGGLVFVLVLVVEIVPILAIDFSLQAL
jgi:hypothetical protein